MGDYPTLTDLKQAYGKNFAAIWLVAQIDNLTLFTGAKNITEQQHEELSKIIAAEYGYLKVTELLLFFHRFKDTMADSMAQSIRWLSLAHYVILSRSATSS